MSQHTPDSFLGWLIFIPAILIMKFWKQILAITLLVSIYFIWGN